MQTEFNYNKALTDKLTIVLPLKGRSLFTIRYFLYMEAVRCPFKILIADGSLDEENKKVIDENKHRWPHVNFEYYRFPPDNTILDFQKKMVGILGKVTTPYVMWNSNDDFYVIDTMLKCVNFLEEDTKQEYSACGGGIYTFYTHRNLPFEKLKNVCLNTCRYYKEEMYDTDSAFDRVISQMPYKCAYIQYAIIRTRNLYDVYKLCCENSILELEISEYFSARYLLACGKYKILQNRLVYSQVGFSTWRPQFLLKRIFLGTYYQDFQKAMQLLATKLSETCETTVDELKQKLTSHWCDSLNPKTINSVLHFLGICQVDYIIKLRIFLQKLKAHLFAFNIFKHSHKDKNLDIIENLMIRHSSFNTNNASKNS
jgi:glycosyltransferase domain-containing protein